MDEAYTNGWLGARRRKQSKPVADMNIDERRREAKRFGRWAAKHERQAKALRAKERKLLEGEDPGVAKDVKPSKLNLPCSGSARALHHLLVPLHLHMPSALFEGNADCRADGAAADAPVPPVSDATSTPESGREEQQACLKEEGEKKKVDVGEEKVDI